MRKGFLAIAVTICSFFANGKPSDWYNPSGSKNVIRVGTVIDAKSGDSKAFYISDGKINVPESYWDHLYTDDVGSYNALKALEQALIARNEVETLAETLDNLDFVTDLSWDGASQTLKYKKQKGSGSTATSSDNSISLSYKLNKDNTKFWLQSGNKNIAPDVLFTTGDGITITKRNSSGEVKVNYDGSLMNDGNKLSVKANEQAAIYKGSTGVSVLLKGNNNSGLTGGLPATGNQVGLAVNVDDATIGISSANKVEIKGASANVGKVLQSNGANECKWLDAGDGIEFENDKIKVKTDDQCLMFDSDGTLIVGYSSGLAEDESGLYINIGKGLSFGEESSAEGTLPVNVNYGYGLYISEDETLGAYKYITKLENNEISLYERSASDGNEEKVGVSWEGMGADGKTLESFTENNKVKARIKGIENTNKILSTDGTNNKWISRGDGIDTDATDYIKVKGNDTKAITVDANGVGVDCDAKSIVVENKKLKVGLSGNSGMTIEGNGGLTLERVAKASCWAGSRWVEAKGAEPDEHSIEWVKIGETNKLQIAGYNNRSPGDRVPVARGGGITWLPYNGGISINGANGTNYVFEAASDTAITFSVDSSVNPVKISVSVHWK